METFRLKFFFNPTANSPKKRKRVGRMMLEAFSNFSKRFSIFILRNTFARSRKQYKINSLRGVQTVLDLKVSSWKFVSSEMQVPPTWVREMKLVSDNHAKIFSQTKMWNLFLLKIYHFTLLLLVHENSSSFSLALIARSKITREETQKALKIDFSPSILIHAIYYVGVLNIIECFRSILSPHFLKTDFLLVLQNTKACT